MAETIEKGCDGKMRWHWYNVMNDLKVQGGLEEVVIDPLSVNTCGCGGTTKNGTRFFVTWIFNTFLMISMSKEEQGLIDAFAKVVEYRPFCRYVNKRSGLLTFEWDKKDPDGRFAKLQNDKESELKLIQ